MGFAGAMAALGRLDVVVAVLIGAVGETVGSYVAWAVGRVGGRTLVDRLGRFVLLTTEDVDRAERWFARHGTMGVLVGRVIPVVRTFQSIPAGVAAMDPLRFGAMTFVGSLVWDGAIAGVGYGLGTKWNTIKSGFSDASYVVVAVAVLAIVAFVAHRLRAVRAERRNAASTGS